MKNIEFISESELKVDGVKFVPEKVSKPEFKVGMWIIGSTDYYNPSVPCRVIEVDGEKVTYCYIDTGCKKFQTCELRPATPAEIESHLRKICDEKYVGKKVRSMHDNFYIQKPISLWGYWPIEDELWYQIGGKSTTNVLVYKQGKFADIIPDKKSKPETREDHKNFLADFCKFWDIPPYLAPNHESFLDQYDFEQ